MRIFLHTVLIIFIFTASNANADIVKLKRGISFEGRVIEEADSEYIVELSVGIVSFKKNEVESIEYFTDLANDQISKEWAPTSSDTSVDQDDDISHQAAGVSDIPSGAQKKSEDIDPDKMVRYQGRYITPEVYAIIQREKEIQERRYKFLQEKKRTRAQTSEKPKPYTGSSSAPKTEPAALGLNKVENFGSNRTRSYGAQNKSQAAFTDDSRYTSFNDAAKRFGNGFDQNTL
jgi:hypothetical protein